jgi:hypothetical protein
MIGWQGFGTVAELLSVCFRQKAQAGLQSARLAVTQHTVISNAVRNLLFCEAAPKQISRAARNDTNNAR